MGSNFKTNKAGMAKLQRDLAQEFSGAVHVPAGGTEEGAVESVKQQLTELGAAPDDATVRKMVCDVRGH